MMDPATPDSAAALRVARPAASRRTAKLSFLALKVTVTGALLYWILSRTDRTALAGSFADIGAGMIAAAIALHATAFACMGVRWWLLLRHDDPGIPLSRVFPSYYLGVFFNLVLPSGIGGDVARTVRLGLHGLGLRGLVTSMIMDRVIGLVTVLGMACAAVAVFPDGELPDGARKHSVALLAVMAVAGAVFLSPWPAPVLSALHRRWKQVRPVSAVLSVLQACHGYRTRPALLGAAAVLSVLSQSLIISVYFLLGRALGLEFSLLTYFAVVPLVFLTSALPISLGGLGVREGALVGLLLALHAEPQAAIALSLAYLLVLWASSLPGLAGMFFRVPAAVPPRRG